jgi:hypothetical protein
MGCQRGSVAATDPPPRLPAPVQRQEHDAAAEPSAQKEPPIGSAQMRPDGTIVLLLRGKSGGATGEGRFVYAPSHPQYRKILEHIRPIKPGEEKLVAPWPDE